MGITFKNVPLLIKNDWFVFSPNMFSETHSRKFCDVRERFRTSRHVGPIWNPGKPVKPCSQEGFVGRRLADMPWGHLLPSRLHLFSSTLHPVHLQHQQSSVCWATGVCIRHHPYWDHQQEGGCPSGDLVRTEQLWTQLCKDRGDGCCHAELQVEGNLLQQMKKFNKCLYCHQLVHLYLLHLHCQGQGQTTAYHFICCEDYFLVIVPGPVGLQSSVGSAEDHGGPLPTQYRLSYTPLQEEDVVNQDQNLTPQDHFPIHVLKTAQFLHLSRSLTTCITLH